MSDDPRNSLGELSLKEGGYYLNGHGDLCGPMDKRAATMFSDNHGVLYFACGQQAGHTHDSLGNLTKETTL